MCVLQNREAQTLMVSSMKSVTVNSSKLLGTAKSVSQVRALLAVMLLCYLSS